MNLLGFHHSAAWKATVELMCISKRHVSSSLHWWTLSLLSVLKILQKWQKCEANGSLSSRASPWGKHTQINIRILDNNGDFIRPNIPRKQCDYTVCWCNVYVHYKRERIINISSVSRNLSFSIMFNCVLEWLILWHKLQNSCNVNFSVFCLLFFEAMKLRCVLGKPS